MTVSHDIRVLVIFGNIPLLGQERGNIQVFKCLKDVGIDSLFVTRKRYGDLNIQPALDCLGLRWSTATFPAKLSRGVKIGTWTNRLLDALRGAVDFIRIIRRYRPTHLHVSNFRHFAPLIPVFWIYRIPIVYRLGDDPEAHTWLFRLLWRFFIIPRMSRFVCISEYIQSRLMRLGAKDSQSIVIYNSPPARIPSSNNLDILTREYAGNTLLYMGQISKEKGVDVLVETMFHLMEDRGDVRLLIAGDYEWRNTFATELIESVEARNLSNRIIFLGFTDAVTELFRISDLHVCPSVWEEPLSNVVAEAKEAGVPSIVFPSGGLPELIVHNVDGFICQSRTSKSLTEAINCLLDLGESEIQKMGENARKSMRRLGIEESQFTLAWREVYRDAI